MGGFGDEGEGRASRALLGAEEVAGYFGVKKATVYRWCKEGRIPCLKVGKRWRVRREALEDFLEEREKAWLSGGRPSEKAFSDVGEGLRGLQGRW